MLVWEFECMWMMLLMILMVFLIGLVIRFLIFVGVVFLSFVLIDREGYEMLGSRLIVRL